MANAKQYLFLITLASWAFVGLGFDIASMACMQKLSPCEPYFKKPDNVPATCCTPMKKMLSEASDENNCVCGVFNNPEVLKKLNTTQDEALKLPKACGTTVDISTCDKKGTSPSQSTSQAPSSSSFAAPRFAIGNSGLAASFITLCFSAAF